MGRKTFKNKLTIFVLAFLIFIGAMIIYSIFGRRESNPTSGERVVLVTSMGNITIELYGDMPITTSNFKNLTELGVYDGTIFHRVIEGFMIQGGDPTGTGFGDPSISTIPDELKGHTNERGTVAMAKESTPQGGTEPDSASSQFFINLVYNSHLDTDFSVFGKVVEGMDIVEAIGRMPTDSNDKPLQDVTIIKAILLE